MGLTTASLIVIANMVGSGVFGITGDIAKHAPSHFAILLSWLVGGIMALCGALVYGELSASMPRSGGEYNYLSQLYHPALGFVSGFVSLVVGFGAAISLNAVIFGEYMRAFWPQINSTWVACLLVILLTLLHAFYLKLGAQVQNSFTYFKIALILIFIIAGFIAVEKSQLQLLCLTPQPSDWMTLWNKNYASAVIDVFYAYLGWNAAAYIAGEIKDPQKNLPRALLIGTLSVMMLYILLNIVFLRTVPLSAMLGEVKVGDLSARAIFGDQAGKILTAFIGVALFSSTSSMVMAGPRVTQSMGEDYTIFRVLAQRKSGGGPIWALFLQMVVALIIIFSATYYEILGYIGFTLSIFSALTVAGIFILRIKTRKTGQIVAYRTFGYPITPALYIVLTLWMVVHSIINRPIIVLFGIATFAIGFLLYYFSKSDSFR
ncbi:MAG: amino acid permease [Bacteroidia bacterium]|nr:amino acid permease [Bacteroidia bacterium]MDW8159098.1 amino acid permease [Bacteroidia bacterium]